MKPHKHAEVLRAIADGKDVQYSRTGGCVWADYRKSGGGYDPLTHVDWFWRVKSERKPDLVEYQNIYPRVGYSSQEIAIDNAGTDSRGVAKITFDGETGKLKSAEVLK